MRNRGTANRPGLLTAAPRRLRTAFLAVVTALAPGSAAWAGVPFKTAVAAVEARLPGRIGVFAMRGDATAGYRAGERFAHCSTFKWVLAAAVQKRADEGKLDLDGKIPYRSSDLINHSPVTGARLREGRMSLADLCAAAITTSDNTAANLLMKQLGGPSGLQAAVRGMGDPVTRFDRIEPGLNSNLPGDPRDTTTPEAMVRLLRTVLETDLLSRAARDRQRAWMEAATTGMRRIRAGVPAGCTVGDKTGTGDRGAANDVGFILAPGKEPVYLGIFTVSDRAGGELQEAAIAEVTRIVLAALP